MVTHTHTHAHTHARTHTHTVFKGWTERENNQMWWRRGWISAHQWTTSDCFTKSTLSTNTVRLYQCFTSHSLSQGFLFSDEVLRFFFSLSLLCCSQFLSTCLVDGLTWSLVAQDKKMCELFAESRGLDVWAEAGRAEQVFPAEKKTIIYLDLVGKCNYYYADDTVFYPQF